MARETRGEGSTYQRCEDRWGCPPAGDDGRRPDHDCRGRWYFSVGVSTIGGGRRRRTTSAATLRELRPKRAALRRQVAAGVARDGSQTVGQWLVYWLDEIADLRPSTERTYRGYITTWIVPAVGKVRLSALTPEQVRGVLRSMEQAGKAPATRRQVLAILSRAMGVAQREGKIERNPCATVTAPSLAKQQPHKALTLDQVKQVMPHLVAHPNAARWLAALVLGIRQGEALGLAWADVHLDVPEPWLRIRQAQVKDAKGQLTLGPVKSAAGERSIPLIEPVLSALAAHREQSGGDGLVWGPRGNRADYNEWHRILESAGVEKAPPHGARGTAATLLDMLGATPRQVADILGHSTVRVGQDHYVHSEAAALRAALTRSGEAMTRGEIEGT